MEKIGELLKEKGVEFKSSSSTAYRFFASFAQDARLKGCDVQILSEDGTIRICAEPPIRIRRDEGAGVSCVIAKMNETMPENAGYILDPIKGSVQLAVQYDMPDNVEELEKMLDWAAQTVDEAVTLLMDTIHEAEVRNRTFKSSWRPADEEQTGNAGTYEEYASNEEWKGASPNGEYSPYEDWKYKHPRKKPSTKLKRFMSKLLDKIGIA